MHYYYTRKKIKSREINLDYIPSSKKLVDILIKPLGHFVFKCLRNSLNIFSIDRFTRNKKPH